MRGSPVLSWCLLLLYAVWAVGLQGILAGSGTLGSWTPDLGMLGLIVWAARMPGGRAPLVALSVALARACFGADPLVALAAAHLGALVLVTLLRSGLEIDRPLARALLCGACAWLSALFLFETRSTVLAAQSAGTAPEGARLWPAALASAGACLVLAPLFARLPGLAPLWRRRP